jgi:proline dehydrogenase
VAFRSTTSKALDCSDPKLAFSSYSTFELLRGATVLTACSQPWLVKHSEPLLALSDRVLGRKATEALLRHSVFAHFVAGETAETIAPTLRGLREKGVGGILDYAAEADLESEGGTDVTVNQPARSYPYVSEAHFNANRRIFLFAVNAVHATTPEGFAAVKVTALGDPALLERVSTAVRELRAFFETLDPAKQGVISRDAFRRGWREAFEMSDEEIEAVFERIDTDMDGNVDLVEFTNALPLHAIGPLVQRCRSKGPLYRSALDVDESASTPLAAPRRPPGRPITKCCATSSAVPRGTFVPPPRTSATASPRSPPRGRPASAPPPRPGRRPRPRWRRPWGRRWSGSPRSCAG